MIIFKNVSFTYKKSPEPVLENLGEQITSNLVITGPSGSGKSTILRLINGLIPHFYEGKFTGDVVVAGRNTKELTTCELFKLAGYVHQNADAQIFNDNIENEIIFTLENAGLSPDVIEERLQWVIEEFGLNSILKKRTHELSGGEKRIVTLASAISLRPSIILLDEPFSTLDGLYREKLMKLLQRMDDTLIVLTEHRIDGVEKFAKKFMFIKDSVNRIVTDNLLKINFANFRVREPELLRLSKLAGFNKIPDLNVLIKKLLDMSYSPEFVYPLYHGEKILSLYDVSFNYNHSFSLEKINIELHRGEVVTLLGPNGAGKTTVMKLMAGIKTPHKGIITRNELTGFVPQNPQDIFFKSSVAEEIRVNLRGGDTWIEKIIHLFGLEKLLHRSPFLLSEGEKKRVAMAAILAMKPGILLLDEPTIGQDGETIRAMEDIITTLSKEGVTVVVSTHDLEFARKISGRWLLMRNGRIVSEVNPVDVTQRDLEIFEELHLDPGISLRIQALRNDSRSKS